jgi:hypothetical protein
MRIVTFEWDDADAVIELILSISEKDGSKLNIILFRPGGSNARKEEATPQTEKCNSQSGEASLQPAKCNSQSGEAFSQPAKCNSQSGEATPQPETPILHRDVDVFDLEDDHSKVEVSIFQLREASDTKLSLSFIQSDDDRNSIRVAFSVPQGAGCRMKVGIYPPSTGYRIDACDYSPPGEEDRIDICRLR